MVYKISYQDSAERDAILRANTDKILIEEDNIDAGNFLIFTDSIPVNGENFFNKETETWETVIEPPMV